MYFRVNNFGASIYKYGDDNKLAVYVKASQYTIYICNKFSHI